MLNKTYNIEYNNLHEEIVVEKQTLVLLLSLSKYMDFRQEMDRVLKITYLLLTI